MNLLKGEKLPEHVAIIMDGNRRWAKKQGLSALGGHDYVVDEVVEPLVDRAIELGIPYLTFWVFSTENWKRSRKEVQGLMNIFRRVLKRTAKDLHEKEVRLKMIGDLGRFPKDIEEKAREWIEISKDNKKITVVFALNYGGRDELLRAFRKLAKEITNNKLQITNFSEQVVEKYLDTAFMPDPDLIIRPGKEKRLSGFMSWQSAYSELYFTDVLMPEFMVEEFDEALEDFVERTRRFGE